MPSKKLLTQLLISVVAGVIVLLIIDRIRDQLA